MSLEFDSPVGNVSQRNHEISNRSCRRHRGVFDLRGYGLGFTRKKTAPSIGHVSSAISSGISRLRHRRDNVCRFQCWSRWPCSQRFDSRIASSATQRCSTSRDESLAVYTSVDRREAGYYSSARPNYVPSCLFQREKRCQPIAETSVPK